MTIAVSGGADGLSVDDTPGPLSESVPEAVAVIVSGESVLRFSALMVLVREPLPKHLAVHYEVQPELVVGPR